MLYPSVDSTINDKGYLLVPYRIRRVLGLKPRQTIKLTVKEKMIELEPQLTLDEIFSFFKPTSRKFTQKELKEEERLAHEAIATNAASEGL